MNPKTEEAFKWIVSILQKHNISFQISGGLAAQAYGSTRKLNDIDIDIPNKKLVLILKEIQPYIIFGPGRYKDSTWDIDLVTLDYYGQEIDISGIRNAKIFNKLTKNWEALSPDLDNTQELQLFGIKVPVISKQELIDYKNKIDYEEEKHLQDIEEIK